MAPARKSATPAPAQDPDVARRPAVPSFSESEGDRQDRLLREHAEKTSGG